MLILGFVFVVTFIIIGIGFVAAGYSCSNDADCKIHVCSTVCVNDSFTTPEGVGCSYPPSMLPDYCKCENNTCKDYKAAGGPVCGNGECEGLENTSCPQDCNETLVGNDSDEHGCKGSAGYSWCEEKQKCLRIWEENCSNTNLPGEGKVKILPEVASLRARERLGELGFNVSLKEVGIGNGNETKSYYEVSAVKEGKMLGLFKVKGKVSVDVDAETGEVMKVHKPWWGFLASGI